MLLPARKKDPAFRRVTARDVAAAAGMSSAAVSYVMTGRWLENGIPQTTCRRIADAAERLGYRPSRIAQGLRAGRSGLVGIIAPCVTFEYFSLIVRGIEDAISACGLTAVLMHTDEDGAKESRKIGMLCSYNVDGLVLIPAVVRKDDSAVCDAIRQGVRFVLVDKQIQGLECPFVGTSDREGARLAVAHLMARGHRRIAHIRGPHGVSTAEDRLAGYYEALRAGGVTPDERLVFGDGWSERIGQEAARCFLSRKPRPTAIFASSDMQAWGVFDVLREAGVAVPAEMAVAGYADLSPSARLAVPLTTVRQPAREIGRRAGEKLVKLIETGEDSPRELRLSVELVVRAST